MIKYNGKHMSEQKQNAGIYHTVIRILKPIAWLLFRPRFEGKENIPASGPVILASNHCHLSDPAFVVTATPRIVRYLAKRELTDSVLGPIYRAMHVIPVDRKGNAHESLVQAEEVLKNGDVIGIFPEGTRNRTVPGGLLPFKYGAVRMARDTKAQIVPIALVSKGIPLFSDYRIRIGEPYMVGEDADLNEENKKLRDRIQELIDRD